jgi:hypothetical protein
MMKKLTTAIGMILLSSSFALAGQTSTPMAPRANQRATSNQRTTTTQQNQTRKHGKKHHKKHHKHNNPQGAASRR